MKILFITGNEHKAKEASAILEGHEVVQLALDLPEIQSLNPEEIILEKLRAARRKVEEKNAVILVEDVSFWIGETGLPGPLIKWFKETIGPKGLVAFGKAFDTDKARAECNVGVLIPGKKKPLFFKGAVKGRLVAPRGTSGFGFNPAFEPDGWEKTYAEMSEEEKNSISHRGKALEQLKEYLDSHLASPQQSQPNM